MKRIATTVMFLFAGCHPPGQVNTDTGLQGVAVAEGSLAGTWATVVELDFIVPAGILGDQKGGFRAQLLVARTFAAGRYTDTFRRCQRESFEVGGSTTLVPPATFPLLRTFWASATADHTQGTFLTDDVIELWGLQNLPDSATTPLPTPDDYQRAPQQDWVLDEDEDGQPAVTEYSRGTVGGRMQIVERTVFALEGTVVSPDRVQGLARLRSNSSSRLSSTAALLVGSSSSRNDPERVSWFDAVRLKDGASCEDVAQAAADGAVAVARPF